MGLFSSKRRHVYTPYSTPIMQGGHGIVRETVVGAVSANTNIATDLVKNILNGSLSKANTLYNLTARDTFEWGLPESDRVTLPSAPEIRIRGILQAELECNVVIVSVTCDSDEGDGGYLYEVEYHLLADNGDVGEELLTWEYHTTDGTYPILAPYRHHDVSPYYPVIPIRIGEVNVGDTGGIYERDVRRSLNVMGIKSSNIYSAIKDSTEESGEQAADDMFVVFGASLSAKDQPTLEYLYRFFQQMRVEHSADISQYLNWLELSKAAKFNIPTLPSSTIEIKAGRYEQTIVFDYIEQRLLNGVKCKVGQYASSQAIDPDSSLAMFADKYNLDKVFFYYQVTDSTYIELEVSGLINRLKVVDKSWVSVTSTDAFKEPDEPTKGGAFLIPLRRDITRDMGNIKGYDLINESVRLQSNDYYTYKEKWYQRGWFKVFLIVVAVVLSFLYPPAGIAAWSLAAAGYALFMVLVFPLVLNFAIEQLARAFGLDIAIIASLVAAAFTGNFSTLSLQLPSMAQVVPLAMSGISQFSCLDASREMARIKEELDKLKEDIKEQDEYTNERIRALNMALTHITNDSFNVMLPDAYISLALSAHKVPCLIELSVTACVDNLLNIDAPNSIIQLGHT